MTRTHNEARASQVEVIRDSESSTITFVPEQSQPSNATTWITADVDIVVNLATMR